MAGEVGIHVQAQDAELRIDDLARSAGVPTTTIRLYRSKGLLPPPRLVGRTGWYGPEHLERLRVIARLQDQGYSLAAIADLLERWERGDGLSDVVGAEQELTGILGRRTSVVVDAVELVERFPDGSLTPEQVQRAAALGLVEVTADGRFRVPDARFLDTGTALVRLGVPIDVVLDEWEHLVTITDGIATRFADLFAEHLLPDDWRSGLDVAAAQALAATLDELRTQGERVLLAALDDSITRVAASRFGELVEGVSGEPGPNSEEPGP